MKNKALFTILSKKFKEGQVLFVDNFNFTVPKTKDALLSLTSMSKIKGYEKLTTKPVNAGYMLVAKRDVPVMRSFSNISNMLVDEIRNINPVTLLNYKYIIIANPKESIDFLVGKINGGMADVPETKVEKPKVAKAKPASAKVVKKAVSKKLTAKS